MEHLGLTAVVCGTFRRDVAGLQAAWDALVAAGVTVLSPEGVDFAGERDGFVFTAGQADLSDEDIEAAHLARMIEADFVWLHAPDGYVGSSAGFEVGFAARAGIPVFSASVPTERVFRPYVQVVDGPEAAAAAARR